MWKTETGKRIPYTKIADSHLLNILKWIEKKSKRSPQCQRKEYVDIGYDGDSHVPDFLWINDVATEKEVLEHYGYKELLKEAKRRKII